jgi:hypothetical protein
MALCSAAHAQGGELIPLAPVHLTEFDNSPIQRGRAVGVDPDGGFYVVDNAQAVVLRFSASGKPVRSYGAKGDGPGEFRGPAAVTVVDDSLVVVTDVRRRNVTVFRRDNGRVVTQYAVSGSPTTVSGRNGEIWVGSIDPVSRMGVVRISMRDSSIVPLVPVPGVYSAGSPIMLLHQNVHVVPLGRSIVTGFSATNVIVNGVGTNDTIRLPARNRRGVPPDLLERMMQAGAAEVYSLSSSLLGLEQLAGGRVVAVHVDVTLPPGVTFPQPPGAPSPFRYRMFASIVNLANRRVCADIPVAIAGDESPSVAVRGDTLYVLDQDATSSDPWVIRRFRINDASCVWQ